MTEVKVLSKTDHPNIIKLVEVWEMKKHDEQICFLVLEYCGGGELFHFIVERGYLTEVEANMVMKQLFEAVKYLHSMGITHRDIKPENFLLSKPKDISEIKVIDFGLSKDQT